MTREIDIDPEVAADIARRESSERDPGRRRHLLRELPDGIVEHWPCRTGCGAMVGQTQAGIDAWVKNNENLVSWHMKPMTKLEVMWCPVCKSADDRERARARDRVRQRPATEPSDPNAAYKPTPRSALPRGSAKLR